MNRSDLYKPLRIVYALPQVNKDGTAGKASLPKAVRKV